MRGVQWNCAQELSLARGEARGLLCLPPQIIRGVALPTYPR